MASGKIKCILVDVLKDQVINPVNLNRSQICGRTQYVSVDNVITDKNLEEVNN